MSHARSARTSPFRTLPTPYFFSHRPLAGYDYFFEPLRHKVREEDLLSNRGGRFDKPLHPSGICHLPFTTIERNTLTIGIKLHFENIVEKDNIGKIPIARRAWWFF